MASCFKCGAQLDAGVTGDVCPKCLLGLGAPTEVEKLLEPGTIFHGLEIVQLLGRGGMGIVYKARQPQLDRFVAVKILPRTLGRDPEFADRFTREARALAALMHPNIVAVHDFGKEGDSFFFVMEFVDGSSLRPILAEHKLSAAEAFKIVPVLCDALEFAHSEGVVHRDIKPENILIDKKGRVKIADFGLAKMLGREQSAVQHMTQSNVIMGTPHYMAPEQFENAKSVDHRADIYSMGVLFYEMLTGELPIGKFSPPSQCVKVDVRFDEIVLRSLEKQPEKRYQSMGDVRRDVTRVMGRTPSGRDIPAAPRKPWVVPAAVAAVAAVLLIFAMRSSNVPDVARTQTLPAQPPGPSVRPNATGKTVGLPPWEASQLAAADLPPGWSVAETPAEAESRADVLKAAGWWGLNAQAEGLQRARKTTLRGPKDEKMFAFTYECADSKALDACLAVLLKNWLPHPNRRLLDKGSAFVLLSSERDGRLAAAMEALEDNLRRKMALPPAGRIDPTVPRPQDLPAPWKETSAVIDIPSLLSALKTFPKPPADGLRDGWVKTWGPEKEESAAQEVSLRFFETETAKAFAKAARTANPPPGSDARVLQEYERVVVVSFPAAGEISAPVGQLLERLAKSMGSGSDDLRLETKAGEATLDEKTLNVPMEISGVSARELTRAKEWRVEMWSGWRDGLDMKLPAPAQFTNKDGVLHATLTLPVSGAVRDFLETAPRWAEIRVNWNAKGSDPFTLSIDLEGKLPATLKDAFADLVLTDRAIPGGWQTVNRSRTGKEPVIATEKKVIQGLLAALAANVDAADVRLVYQHILEPKKTQDETDELRVVVVKLREGVSAREFSDKLADLKKTTGCEEFLIKHGGRYVTVYLRFGPNSQAAYTKLMNAHGAQAK